MNIFSKQDVITVLEMLLIILATHAVFFMAYSYCMSGDTFLSFWNFYEIMYNVRL